MYIRKTKTGASSNKNLYTHRVVESFRTSENKVQQRTLLNLGANYCIPQEWWKLLCARIEEILNGQTTLIETNEEIESEAQRVATLIIKKHGITNIEHQEVKSVGAEQLAYAASNKLNITSILSQCGFSEKDINTALGTIIGRLVYPGSEVSTARNLRFNSALDEIIGSDFSTMNKNKLYNISDELLKHKKFIEQELYNKEKELFGLKEIVTLYDLTNTYFEGSATDIEYAAHGRSKEKRTDRPIVTLALVLDGSGFPKKSRIYAGNVSEGKTLEAMISDLETKDAIVVMDAGIATEENLNWLATNDYKYLVVSRKRQQDIPNVEGVVVKKDPKAKVTTFLLKHDQESELYCHSEAMEHKSNELSSKYVERFKDGLLKLSKGLNKKGCTKKYDKIQQKIGRLKEKYSKVSYQFNIDVQQDKQKNIATKITWTHDLNKQNKQPGIYCIRTNQTGLSNQEIWDTYRMLNSVESAFRHLKTDLGLRPIYHRTDKRVQGHIFISVLAYHLLHTIRHQLKAKGIDHSWSTILEIMKTHYRITTICKNRNNNSIYIRKSMRPNKEQLELYKACNFLSKSSPTKIIKY